MIALVAVLALYAVFHYGMKYNFGWTPIDFVFDLLGDVRVKKEKNRENLNVLINFIHRADSFTAIELTQVKTVLEHRNPLTVLSKKEGQFIFEVLRDIAKRKMLLRKFNGLTLSKNSRRRWISYFNRY